jgi:PKD repeat protein
MMNIIEMNIFTMKKLRLFLFVCLSFVMISANGQYVENPQKPEKVLELRKEIFFRIDSPISVVKSSKIKNFISIDEITDQGIYAYANEAGYQKLKALQIDFTLLYNPSELIQPNMFSGQKVAYEWDTYPTYEAYVDMIYQFATDHPDLCSVEAFGSSTEGRDLLAVKISDNVDVDEGEPEFFYTSTMHGDETVGYILMLRLIDYLLENYGTLSSITDMVDGMEIYINPLANPDGTYAGGNNTVNGATRYNANGVDLNRNYPDFEDGPHPDGNAYQVETEAFMTLAEAHHFVGSANFHSGAEVVNYPWDTWAKRHPDDNWYQLISREYADTVHLYAPSGYMTMLNNGITNGYDWYTISGSRQDYMNYYRNCREVTIELSDIKLLPENELNAHWEYNYRSLLNYIEQSAFGFRGTVTDLESGNPVQAKVTVVDHDEDHSFVYGDDVHGTYYRPIKSGTYDLLFEAPCYESELISGLTIDDYQVVVQDVELLSTGLNAVFESDETFIQPGETVHFFDASCGNPVSWDWTFEGGAPPVSSDPNPVVTYDNEGTYDVTLTVSDGVDESTLIMPDYVNVMSTVNMGNETVTTCSVMFYDQGGPDGNYSDNTDFVMTFFPVEANAMVKAEFFEFSIEPHATCSYDWLKIFDGTAVSAPQIGGSYCGSDSPGTVTATNSAGALTFQFHSDNSVNGSGWEAQISCSFDLPPVADFSADTTQVAIGNEVQFFQEAQYGETYEWYFEGGIPETSTEPNPRISYETLGTYDVELTVTNMAGEDTEFKPDYIDVVDDTGISEIDAPEIMVYPNPLKRHDQTLHVVSQRPLERIQVMHLNGKVVINEKAMGNEVSFAIHGLRQGMYLIKIHTTQGVFVKKLELF